MTSLAARLARPEILALPPFDIAATSNSEFSADAIRLDANENPFPPLLDDGLAGAVNRYPEPQPAALKSALAALYGVPPGSLVVTRGADDAIDILVRAFCRPGLDAISVCPPTFAAYAHFAALQGARLIEAPLNDDFGFDGAAFLDAVRDEACLKLAFLCSPNNPTGNLIPAAKVIELAEAAPSTIVVLDEAYVEFAEAESLVGEAARRENLVVLRTLSKAFGLAGARIGAAIGHPETIALAARALPPYPLPSPSIAAALAALSPIRRRLQAERVATIKDERARLAGLLATASGVRSVRRGGGNFLFLDVDEPDRLAARLRRDGIRVRFRPKVLPGGVRISIGTELENAALLAAFGIGAARASARRAELVRETKETAIAIAADLDRAVPRRVRTGLPFFDHMLDQVAAHGGFSLLLDCRGDIEVDAHHSIEDCAITLGQAIRKAIGDKRGIGRFGFSLPMDEAEAHALIDFSGRPYSRFEATFRASHIGAYPTEMTAHVFRSLADGLGAAIHIRASGENDHHKTEACFKAFGRALRQAIARPAADAGNIPSTKGVL